MNRVIAVHEMSICEGILQVLEDQARTQNYHRVKGVWLEIGPLAGVELEALKFGFDVVMKNSVAEGADLYIIETPGQAWCLPCSKTVPIGQRFDACPDCGSYQLQVTGGDELKIKELEVC